LKALFINFTLLGVTSLHAADVVWDGDSDADGDGVTLDLNLNWVGDVLPSVATPDTGVFNGTDPGALVLTYGGGLAGAAGNIGLNLSLTGTQTSAVSIDSGLVTTNLRLNNVTLDSGSGAFTLGNSADVFNITIGGADNQLHTWTNNSSNTATVNSDVRIGLGGGGNHMLAFTGTGNWSVSAPLAPSAGGQLSLAKFGTGQLTLAGGGTFDNDGAGAVNLNGGAWAALFHGGTTLITSGTYTVAAGEEVVIGGLDTTGVNTSVVMDGGSMTGSAWLSIARGNGTGATTSSLTLNNSAAISTTNLGIGFNAGNGATLPKGTITLNNTSSITTATTGLINLAESAGSDGTITVNDSATLTSAGDLRVGIAGTGKLFVNNTSVVNVGTTVEKWLKINDAAGGSGQIDVNGGSINLNTNTDLRFSTVAAANGTNVVNLNSGSISGLTGNNNGVFSGTSQLDLNYASTQAGVNNTFNLNGGTLTIGQIITTNNAGNAAFNFNGGTLRAAATTADFINLGGANQRVNVRNGGAIFDTNTFDVTVAEALLHSNIGGDNATDGGLTKTGVGTLTITNAANTYTGATTVLNGNLATGLTGNLGTGNVTVTDTFGASLTLGNGSSIADTATLFFGDDAEITLDNGSTETLAGITQLDDSQSIGAGVYTAGDLNTFFGVSTFLGEGTLTVVPEPSAALLGGLGVLGLLRRRRKA
jgi:autotransporter-associated beta strand protein/T5SS/PEP-CTERM-associated repeat protein